MLESSLRERQCRTHPVMSVCVLTLMVLIALALSVGGHSPLFAADQPAKGGTIIFAVHEYGPSSDIHYETSYIAIQGSVPSITGW
jgi:hypothetical protein